jgi:large repetitive protein
MTKGITMLVLGAVSTATVVTVALSPSATATVPSPTGNNAVITVKVGGDRSGVSNVTGVAGAILGLFTTATATTPVAGFGTCTSDSDGDCNFTVPNAQTGGANRDKRFYVKEITAPPGYFANATLATGTSPVTSTSYSFQTGTELRAGKTYSSQSDFMFATGSANNAASGGVWQNSRTNPTLPPQCGLRVAIVTDLSNSVGADLVNLKAAANAFVQALVGTPTTVSLFTFATQGPAAGASNINRPAFYPVSTQSGANTVMGFINGLTLPGGNDGGTNWDRGLAQVAEAKQHYDIAVVITDGNPTFYGNPTQGPGNRSRFAETENGIFSANAIKAEGTRMLAMGVGSGVSGPADNLRSISGPTPNDDYSQSSDYAAAGQILRAFALGRCVGSITVVKQIVPPTAPPGSIAGAVPAGGWQFDASSSNSGLTIAPTSGQTAIGTGAINFGLSFAGGVTSAPAAFAETQQPGYILQPVSGANAVCTRQDTGAMLPVTNTAGGGFSVDTSSAFGISCEVYNRAPDPLAAITVTKQWIVNGQTFDEGDQPPGLFAQLTIDGADEGWGQTRQGFVVGDVASIDETTSITGMPLCTLDTSQVTMANGATVSSDLPYAATLSQVSNNYQITNTVTCSSRLTLTKVVDGGSAAPTAWTLTATGPPDALPGPSGTTPVTADVTGDASYVLSESGGDPRYVQDLAPGAELTGQATGSWVCVEVGATGLGRTSTPREFGLNGSITVPLGTWTNCTTVNRTAMLTLIKQVVNSHGGIGVPSDWMLTGSPVQPVPGLTAETVQGSAIGQTIQVRPGLDYALSESGPSGYDASGWGCSTVVARSGAVVSIPPGGEGTCAIVNHDVGPSLTLVKDVDNGATGATTRPSAWTLKATGPTTISGATGSSAVTSASVDVGTYDLSEAGPTGYFSSHWSCSGATASSATSVTLGLSDNATCTITNTAIDPRLTLVKKVHNVNGGTAVATDWTLNASGPTELSGVTADPAVTDVVVQVGDYRLSESGPQGYSPSAWTCIGGTVNGSTVSVGVGARVTCTVTNTDTGAVTPPEPPSGGAGSGGGGSGGASSGGGSALPDTGAAVNPQLWLALEVILTGFALLLMGFRRRRN